MALSEAEKRQKLRERRAAKIKDGASRLGKITGDYPEAQKETAASTTPEPKIQTRSSSSAGSNPNRISQNFDHDDPDIQDITKFEPVREKEEDTDLSTDAQQFEEMLQKMLSSQQHQHSGGENSAPGSSEFDIFSQLLGGDGNGLGGLGGLNSPTAETNEKNEYEAKLADYNKAINDQYKAKLMVLRGFFSALLTIWIFHFQGFHSSSYEIMRFSGADSGFVKIWSSFEIIFTSIYALHLTKIKDSHYNYNSKILTVLGYIPDVFLPLHWKNKIRWFVKYQELINLIIFDMSIVVVIFGLLSFLHRIQI